MRAAFVSSFCLPLLLALAPGCSAISGTAPKGSEDAPEEAELSHMKEVGGRAAGTIVWSSSRLGNHDLFTMKTDGSDVKAITKGDQVDWFPRFSPDGSQILFVRSRQGWVSEKESNDSDKWDLYTIHPDGTGAEKVVSGASWGSYITQNEIVFQRGTKIFRTELGSKSEKELLDSTGVPDLDGSLLQQPTLSKDGKYLAITLRGAKRETGIWDLEKKKWNKTGLGCQVSFAPGGDAIYWVNPTGNGGSQIFRMPFSEKGAATDTDEDKLVFMDMPGRRSHEYFPKLSSDGKWMVWGITQRGHDHDIADYEIYLWEVGKPAEDAVRLTHHSGNDRWPDIFISSGAP